MQWEADCRELEALCDELRQLSPLISVQRESAVNQVSVAIGVLQFRPGVRPRISFESSMFLRRTRSDARVVNRPGQNESNSFSRLPDLRNHLEKHLMAEIAKAISSQGIERIEIYNNGHEAGKQWAAHCEPQERRRLWKNRRDLTDSDSESVFETFCPPTDDNGIDDQWESLCEEFWEARAGDAPTRDFVMGFVAGALSIIAKIRMDQRKRED